jgi:protein-S-isoprenylcysteine O-methyltransferase Ste14
MRQKIILRVRKDFIGTSLVGISLFAAAGRLDWPMGWVYMGMNYLGLIVNLIVLVSKNPQVLAARAEITQEGTEKWDKVFTAAYGPMLLIIAGVCGLDAGRFGWSTVPAWVQALSIALFITAWLFSLWALVSNEYFETSVRIQEDRSHKTVTGGPYTIVRHPGYVGVVLVYAATPPFLGSWWGLIPSAVLMIGFILRTAWEDRTLLDELPDYPAYARKVRYRLLPGVW